jgi:hypothetical protein
MFSLTTWQVERDLLYKKVVWALFEASADGCFP